MVAWLIPICFLISTIGFAYALIKERKKANREKPLIILYVLILLASLILFIDSLVELL